MNYRDVEHSLKAHLAGLPTPGGADVDEKVLTDALTAMQRVKSQHAAQPSRMMWRTIMTIKTRRIAAVVALAVLLLGALGVGTGSAALSQTHHAVNATLAWLKSMISGGGTETRPPLPLRAGQAGEQTAKPGLRVITCAARFFRLPPEDQGVWQSLKNRGIELVAVSTDPPVYYATLTRAQAETIEDSLTLPCISTPRVTTSEGDTAVLALTNTRPAGGLTLGWLPTVSSDGREVQSTISFHDGQRGFELPNVNTESGGVVLLRTRGMFTGLNQDRGDPGEVLIRLQVDIQ